jgi:outer membrane protein assembly factor BamB
MEVISAKQDLTAADDTYDGRGITAHRRGDRSSTRVSDLPKRGRAIGAAIATAIVLIGGLSAWGAATASAAAVSWPTYGFNDQRGGYNPSETTIGSANAAGLHKLWGVGLGAVMIAQPIEAAGVTVGGVATNVVYEGTEHGDMYAVNASDGHVIWRRNLGSVLTTCTDMPDDVFGIGGAGAIAFTGTGVGVVYVAGGDGAVHALDLATGTEEPGWPVTGVFTPSQEHVYGGLNLSGGKLYVVVASHCDSGPYHGAVVKINVSTRAIVSRFNPSGGVWGGGIWGAGGVSISPSNGDVFTATGNAIHTPENYLYSDSVVELSPALAVVGWNKPSISGNDYDFGATPTLFRPAGCPLLAAAMNKTGALFVYTAGSLSSGYRQRLQMANLTGAEFVGVPAWDPATNMLYVPNSSDSISGPYRHGLVALKAAADCHLSLAWQQTVGPNPAPVSPPSVAHGVVYYGDGSGDQELAFNAATGRPLWNSGTTSTAGVYAAPTIVNGELLVASWDHHLYAFGP